MAELNADNDLPNHRYYRQAHGHWTSPFEFKLLSWSEFWKCPLNSVDRIRLLATFLMTKLVGPPEMETEVDYYRSGSKENKVFHKTYLKKWGFVFMESHETFDLNENGQDVLITMEQSFWPFVNKKQALKDNYCQIEACGTKARYDFSWFGTRLKQTTKLENDRAYITMDVGWAKGVQILRRKS